MTLLASSHTHAMLSDFSIRQDWTERCKWAPLISGGFSGKENAFSCRAPGAVMKFSTEYFLRQIGNEVACTAVKELLVC